MFKEQVGYTAANGVDWLAFRQAGENGSVAYYVAKARWSLAAGAAAGQVDWRALQHVLDTSLAYYDSQRQELERRVQKKEEYDEFVRAIYNHCVSLLLVARGAFDSIEMVPTCLGRGVADSLWPNASSPGFWNRYFETCHDAAATSLRLLERSRAKFESACIYVEVPERLGTLTEFGREHELVGFWWNNPDTV